ncbi:hypothetical protein KP509_04G097800 [Ceratopteris richardii]|nr:hypothetical protein KP509_04G097800 [Ceratopteris richardii]KAH7440241.1 hypothetical protein KP509_04G097800 [Ceratopteris richardii]
MGRYLHSLMLANNIEISGSLGSLLIQLFASHGALLEANLVFSQVSAACVAVWEAIIEAHCLLSQTDILISLYFKMKEEDLLPSKRIVLCTLQACTRDHKLVYGRIIDDQAIRTGRNSDVAVGSCLINMYAKCGSIAEAQKVFDILPFRNVVIWNVLLASYARADDSVTVLSLFDKMERGNISPGKITFLCVLKAFNGMKLLGSFNLVYNNILKFGFDVDSVISNSLIDLYAKCGHLQEAYKVFESLKCQDVVSWNALISGHIKAGQNAIALQLLSRMQKEGFNPDAYSFSCAFQACGSIAAEEEGNILHNNLVLCGVDIDVHVASTLLCMYGKCGKLVDACHVFESFPHPNHVMWGIMIAGYTQKGCYICGLELFERMQEKLIEPDVDTFPYILNSCANLGIFIQGMVVHNQLSIRHLEANVSVCNALIDMYSKCGCLGEAQHVFAHMSVRDVVSWNSLIAGCTLHGDHISALSIFVRMMEENINADDITSLAAVKSCTGLGAILQGMELHHSIFVHGLEAKVALGSNLVDMYVKLQCIEEAAAVFWRLPFADVVSCSAMLSGYVQDDSWSQCADIYDLMVQKNIQPDSISFSCLLKAASQSGNASDCRILHDEIIKTDLHTDVMLANTLINVYAKCSSMHEAHYVFNVLPERSLSTWNTIMTGYAENDNGFQVLKLFDLMHREGLNANKVSYLSTLKACCSLGSVDHVFYIHDQVIRNLLESDSVVGNMMVDTYARCGHLDEAHRIFDRLLCKDVVSWSALIAGYAQHKGAQLARQYLFEMQQKGIKPVGKTFTSILGAYSNAGCVEEGNDFFKLMRQEFHIIPSIEHYNCMIDSFCRAGLLDEAKKFLYSMPILPNVTTWMSLLTSSRTFGDIEFGRFCFNQATELYPYNSSAYMIMSKLYADANMWTEVHKLEGERKRIFAWKKPGKACVEVDGQVHEFTAGETASQYSSNTLRLWIRILKNRGYVPDSNSVLDTEVEV